MTAKTGFVKGFWGVFSRMYSVQVIINRACEAKKYSNIVLPLHHTNFCNREITEITKIGRLPIPLVMSWHQELNVNPVPINTVLGPVEPFHPDETISHSSSMCLRSIVGCG